MEWDSWDKALGPGHWVIVHLGKWILSRISKQSAWRYRTSSGGAVSGEFFGKISGAGGQLWFSRGTEVVEVKYGGLGAGFTLSPTEAILDFSVPKFPSRGGLWLAPDNVDFQGPSDFTGPSIFLIFEEKVLAGYQVGVVLLGVHDSVIRRLKKISGAVESVNTLLKQASPPGFWNHTRDALTRPIKAGYTFGQAYKEIVTLLLQLQWAPETAFKGALFMEGTEVSVGLPTGAGIAVGATAYFGGCYGSVGKLP